MPGAAKAISVDIVIPVLNEERALGGCVRTLHAFLADGFPFGWRITVVDNGSTDRTWDLATELTRELPAVHARRLDIKGRGAALRAAWQDSRCDIVAYMDVDLSTGLDALLPMIAPLVTGNAEVMVGSRLAPGARVRRGLQRELVSRSYNLLLRLGFRTGFRDAQCGFKAARTDLVKPLLELVEDDRWFFDTELLLLAEFNGLRVREVAVDWIEDVDTRVKVVGTAMEDLRGMVRVARAMISGRVRATLPPAPEPIPAHPEAVLARPQPELRRRLLSFGTVGALSAALHACLYLMLRPDLSPAMSNLLALIVSSVFNTEANRLLTFNRAGGPRFWLHLRAGLLFLVTYLFTTGVVTALLAIDPEMSRGPEVCALVVAYLAMTLVRFITLDRYVFARSAQDA